MHVYLTTQLPTYMRRFKIRTLVTSISHVFLKHAAGSVSRKNGVCSQYGLRDDSA